MDEPDRPLRISGEFFDKSRRIASIAAGVPEKQQSADNNQVSIRLERSARPPIGPRRKYYDEARSD
jgi:hypothetical protein